MAELVADRLAESVASARESWRASRLRSVAIATRSITEEQVRNRDAVVASFARRGHDPDVIAGQHRAVYRNLARQEVTNTRLGYVGIFVAIVVVLGLWLGIGSYFGIPFGVVLTILAAYGGVLIVGLPVLLIPLIFRRLPSFGLAVVNLYLVLVSIAAGLIVYGALAGAGPARPLIGAVQAQIPLAFVLVEGILTTGILVATFILGWPVALYVERCRLLVQPHSQALRVLFHAIAMSATDEVFLRTDTRRQLVDQMEQLAVIIRAGLWKTVRPSSGLARSVLRYRCDLAAQTVEVMSVWVTLPAKTTRVDYQERMCAVAETMMSGRLDELPVEPRRDAISLQSRLTLLLGFLRTIVIGAVPLGVFYGLALSGVLPPAGIAEPVRVVLWVWLVVALLSALGELGTGRTLFDRTLELLSRILNK
ncbi:hypothetical protein [Amycolatopsis sp. lyj-346]|uniref:hypothetical protein n=1 Tax=Amycolatopsis sp. lyj-346 TaxID=2789289 RepID=UPI00397A4D9B